MNMIHTCLRVFHLETSSQFYQRAFDMSEYARYEFETFTLLYLRSSDATFELELTHNHDRTTPYQLGDGYGHLAVASSNLEEAHEKAKSAGGNPTEIKSLQHAGSLLGRFFFATDPDGYKIEVLAREGRFAT